MTDKHRNPALRAATAAFIESLLPLILEPMRAVAREHGYALAVHGSLARDIDVVAVPWTDHVGELDDLARSIQGAVAGVVGRCYATAKEGALDWKEKPQGRRALTLLLPETHVWIDLSVMPRLPKVET